MVGVGEDLAHDVPRQGPAEVVLIHEKAHELGDADGRMRIVELHCDLVGELLPAAAGLGSHEGADHVLLRAHARSFSPVFVLKVLFVTRIR